MAPPPPDVPPNFNRVLLPLLSKYRVFNNVAHASGAQPNGVKVKTWTEQARDETVRKEMPSGVCHAVVERWLAAQYDKGSIRGFREEFADGIPKPYVELQRQRIEDVRQAARARAFADGMASSLAAQAASGTAPSADQMRVFAQVEEGKNRLHSDAIHPVLEYRDVVDREQIGGYRRIGTALEDALHHSKEPNNRCFRLSVLDAKGARGHAIGLRCKVSKAMWNMLDPNSGEWTHIRTAIFVPFIADYFEAAYRKGYVPGFISVVEARLRA